MTNGIKEEFKVGDKCFYMNNKAVIEQVIGGDRDLMMVRVYEEIIVTHEGASWCWECNIETQGGEHTCDQIDEAIEYINDDLNERLHGIYITIEAEKLHRKPIAAIEYKKALTNTLKLKEAHDKLKKEFEKFKEAIPDLESKATDLSVKISHLEKKYKDILSKKSKEELELGQLQAEKDIALKSMSSNESLSKKDGRDSTVLGWLESSGVDNWTNYSDAIHQGAQGDLHNNVKEKFHYLFKDEDGDIDSELVLDFMASEKSLADIIKNRTEYDN